MGALYTFKIDLNWLLVKKLSEIDRFAGQWSGIVLKQGQTLKQLKSIATVRSVGASTRIEGSKLTDDEVEVLIENLKIEKLVERDQQEVIGYFETLDLISESFTDMNISESTLKSLHNILMKYSTKDEWHKGDYKKHPNSVEATHPDGSKYVIFETSKPGWDTSEAMSRLIEWYNQEKDAPPIVRVAAFVYEFLSIHPFQDGNGRLSRLLATLLLLKQGYSWIEYVSFEHEIESRKGEYYKVLMECQRNRPGEEISLWNLFFIDCLANIQKQLIQKLETKIEDVAVSPRLQQIRMYIEHHGSAKTSEIADRLGIPLPTVKKDVNFMITSGILIRHGKGAGTHYSASPRLINRADQLLKFDNKASAQSFQLIHPGSSRTIKKIILTPKFEWVQPDDWAKRLIDQGLYLFIRCTTLKGQENFVQFLLSGYNTPYLFQPVFTLKRPIEIPETIMGKVVYQYEYPLTIDIELKGIVPHELFLFDVLVVYDERH